MSTATPGTPAAAPSTTGTQTQFSTPARWNDFPDDPALYAALTAAWTVNVNAWTQQAITGNPWNVVNGSNQTFYYNPLTTPNVPPPSSAVQVTWGAMPNRILYYYQQAGIQQPPLTADQTFEMADTGVVQGVTLVDIPNSAAVCAGQSQPTIPFGPYGPRGWLDEYCEWAVTRDANNNIIRVDFCCENPEYWYTLWSVSPERVAELYQTTLGKPQIQLSDLYLYDDAGNPVVDPSTGRPAYNPLNKWNAGTVSTDTAGGAMHLTSTPNNLGTEIALAGAASVQRTMGNSNAQALLCCGGPYGQPQRNSDPTIGQKANQAVAAGNRITLADPVGLYIQTPNWSAFGLPNDPNLPQDAQPSDCWTVVRGYPSLEGFNPNDNFILHAVFQIPQSWKDAGVTATVSDMTINLDPIRWGAQIAGQFNMALYPLPLPTTETPPKFACVTGSDPTYPQPLQLFHQSVFDAYYVVQEPNPRLGISLASNTVLTPPTAGAPDNAQMCITCDTVDLTYGLPTVEFFPPGASTPDQWIAVTVTGTQTVTYAIPGNSYPGTYTSVQFTLQVDSRAAAGVRDVRVTNARQRPGASAPGFLQVVARAD
jgi:hypothetical protein